MFHVRNLPRNESDMDNITLRFVSCSNNFLLIYQRGTVYTADAGLFLPRCSIACLHLQTVWLGLEFARTQLMIDTALFLITTVIKIVLNSIVLYRPLTTSVKEFS